MPIAHTLAELRSGALAGARELKISEGLTRFPEEILDLSETLEILDLSGNRLEDLPPELGRLRKLRILFLSQNRFRHVPEVLSECHGLSMIGFKSNRIEDLPQESLPASTRWLILTDNRLERLPDSIGDLPLLQKAMFAGNRLRCLPESLRNCRRLELLRISANRLEALPDWLGSMPRLSWLAWSGNPFCAPPRQEPARKIPWTDLELGGILGQGASGVISRATWRRPDGIRPVAAKIFKGEVTSDGYPGDEMTASLEAGKHPNLVAVEGRLEGHPENRDGLVLSLIPSHYRNLGGPPSYETCTRDVFPEDSSYSPDQSARIARGVASLCAHLHDRGIQHGDLYAHNILVDDSGHPLLGDFGAASRHEGLPPAQKASLQSLDVRAYGYLLDDLLPRTTSQDPTEPISTTQQILTTLRDACLQDTPTQRPTFQELTQALP